MASAEYEAVIAALDGRVVAPGDSLEAARKKLDAIHGHPVSPGTAVGWTKLAGVSCAWVAASEAANARRVLFLCHGGAFIAAGGDGYLFYAEMLSRSCGARVLLVDYRLAPEHRHPAALEDCVAAYSGLMASGVVPAQVGFVGDSCGGGLVVATLLRLRELGLARPALAVCLSGWFDLEADSDSAREAAGKDPFAHFEFTRQRARDYVGDGGSLRDPLVSPVHADLRELPPLLLQVGQIDLTRDEACLLAARAARAGVDVTLEVHPEMVHGFQGLAYGGVPEAVRAVERVASFVAARI